MVPGQGWEKCCLITCGTSVVQGMASATCSSGVSHDPACLQSERPSATSCGGSAGLGGHVFNAEEGKNNLAEPLPSAAFPGCPWRSATATINASGMARSSRGWSWGCGQLLVLV